MDPYSLAAIGLAGNIVQFIDFGAKLLSKANQIRKEGSTAENVHLGVVTKDLSRYIDSLNSAIIAQQREKRVLGEEDTALYEICGGCLQVAHELETALEGLGSNGRVGKWKSYRHAFKSIWGKSRVTELRDRLSVYSSQMDRRLLASIKNRADVAFLEQAGQLAEANVGIQAALERLREIEQTSQQNAEALMLNDETILKVVETSAASNNTEHFETRAVVAHAALELQEASASNHDQTREQVASIGIHVASAVETASEENRQQHEGTRVEMERVRLETEKQIRELREEIRLLKIEIEQSVQKVVASVGNASAREQQRLKEWSNAKFNLWVAKEIMLKKLLEILNLFKSQVGDWVAAFEASSWKLQAYPKTKMSLKPSAPSSQLSSESTNDQPAPTRDATAPLSDAEADLLYIVRGVIKSGRLHMLESLNSRDVQRLSSKRNLFEVAFDNVRNNSHLKEVILVLLDYGLSPTDLAFQRALESFDENTIKLIGDALISNYSSAAVVIHGSLNASTRLARAIRDQNLKDMVVLLNQEPSCANSPIIETGNLPLASAVLWKNYRSAGMLVLLGASPVLSLAAGKSPVVIAVEKADLRMANILVGTRGSSLETGWEWNVAKALATINFNAPGDLLDLLINKMGIPLCLRLAIEHRHERLIAYMLWQFKTRSSAYLGTEAESDEVLEQALRAGISKDYVQYIKSNRRMQLTHMAKQSQGAEDNAHRKSKSNDSKNVLELIDFAPVGKAVG